MTTTEVDLAVVEGMANQLVGMMAGAAVCAGVVLGDQVGLYRAMAGSGPLSAADVAKQAGCNPRLTQEWLDGQASAGLLAFDADAETYELTPEAAIVLADEDSPGFLAGGVAMFQAIFDAMPKVAAAFQGDGAVAWGEHHPSMYRSVARFFRPGYRTNLVTEWIPAMEGIVSRLDNGGRIADIGCGYGHSCVVMADAYPNASVHGFDFHGPSIEAAREHAEAAGLSGRVSYEAVSATDYEGEFDLICFFDCLHDMGDPVGIARYAHERLAPGGSVLLVEPFALSDRASNIAENPAAPLFYHASTFVCTPCSMAQDVGRAMGAQSGESGMKAVFDEAGFSQFRPVHESPFNIVYQAIA